MEKLILSGAVFLALSFVLTTAGYWWAALQITGFI